MRLSTWQDPARFPLTALLGQGSHLRVLRVLSASDEPQGTATIATEAGLTPQGTRLALDALSAEGLVATLGTGRTRLFRLDESHPLGKVIRQLFAHEAGSWQRWLAEVRKIVARDKAVLAAWYLEASPDVLRQAGTVDGVDGPRIHGLQLILLGSQAADLADARTRVQAIATGMRIRAALLCLDGTTLQTLTSRPTWRRLFVAGSSPLKGPTAQRWLEQRPAPPQPGLF